MKSKIMHLVLWAFVSLSITISAYVALMFLAWKSFMRILSFDFGLPILFAYALIAIGVISFAVFIFFIYKIFKLKLSE